MTVDKQTAPDPNDPLKKALDVAIDTMASRFPQEVLAQLRSILLTNYSKGRVHWYTEGDPSRVENYVARVCEIHSRLHTYLEKVQIEWDEQIWEELFLKIQRWSKAYFIRKGFNPAQVSDEIAFGQDAEAAMAILRGRYPYDTDFEAWVKVIINNCCLKYMRDNMSGFKEPPVSIEILDRSLSSLLGEKTEEEKQVDQQDFEILLDAIRQLKRNRKKIIQHRYFENLSLEEIANKMNKSLPAIYSLHFRALLDLRKILEEKGIG